MRLVDRLQEVRELGVSATVFRARWEAWTRFVAPRRPAAHLAGLVPLEASDVDWPAGLSFGDPCIVRDAMRTRMSDADRAGLKRAADAASHGVIVCFGGWLGDYGDPVDWFVNPQNGERWPMRPWSLALADGPRVGDVKLTWEIARFPHAYAMAQAAAFFPEHAEHYADRLAAQMASFVAENPLGLGVHWASAQECALRQIAWLFAHDTLLRRSAHRASATRLVASSLAATAEHTARLIVYSQRAVYNNHLTSEALVLYAAGILLPSHPDAEAWRELGRRTLDEEAEKQFYSDGAYIQLSHTYERVALVTYLWAIRLARAAEEKPPEAWLAAMDRALFFLAQQQNVTDGRLPNYGPNDGAYPSPLSSCAYNDFRPVLQAVSCASRGERIYDEGPWDEMAAWLVGPAALDMPLRPITRRSTSFAKTGFHVLRAEDPRTFATFRCGDLRDRFGQIDMLHVDFFWRGLNVAIDGGSFLYNGPEEWHSHFMSTASHNTITVDGKDQMLHARKFKYLYWTRARFLSFDASSCEGEHDGYTRHEGSAVHKRRVELEGETLVVTDEVRGEGEHTLRLHWLLGEFPWAYEAGTLTLDTTEGMLDITVTDGEGNTLLGDVAFGQESPPRGFMSRHYGKKVAVPSLAVEVKGALPLRFVTTMRPREGAVSS